MLAERCCWRLWARAHRLQHHLPALVVCSGGGGAGTGGSGGGAGTGGAGGGAVF